MRGPKIIQEDSRRMGRKKGERKESAARARTNADLEKPQVRSNTQRGTWHSEEWVLNERESTNAGNLT